MRIEIRKWGNSAALRIPARVLRSAGLQVGQTLELHVEQGRLVLEPAAERLETLLANLTLENRHGLEPEDRPAGAEAW